MENVKQDTNVGTNILRVSASDEDADNNGAIIYSLAAPGNPADLEYFEIQPESGWITLKKPLDVSFFDLLVTFHGMQNLIHLRHLVIQGRTNLYWNRMSLSWDYVKDKMLAFVFYV